MKHRNQHVRSAVSSWSKRTSFCSSLFALRRGPVSPQKSQRGVALILVIFIVSLASILVINLAYSTYLGARLNSSVEHSLQAEYLMKSALNLARILIRADLTPSDDAIDDPWRPFLDGTEIPAALFGIEEPNLRVALEIRPEESKLPLGQLVSGGGGPPDQKWVDTFTRFFQYEGFDTDKEQDTSGLVATKDFDSKALVANLIDYMDADKTSYDKNGYKGIEDELKEDVFPNRQIQNIRELSTIPGFTSRRINLLQPYLSVPRGITPQININSAPLRVINALHADFTPAMLEQIDQYRRKEGFKRNGSISLPDQLVSCGVDNQIAMDIFSMIGTGSSVFQIIAKVDYQTSIYFLRAYVRRDNSSGSNAQLPNILSLEVM